MTFREWLRVDETRFKGFERQFRQQYPDVPNYVLKQVYNNHMSPSMRNALHPLTVHQEPTAHYFSDSPPSVARRGPHITTPHFADDQLPSTIMKSKDLIQGVAWNPKPQVLSVSPQSFDDHTLAVFERWRFGLSPRNDLVHNDERRFDTQRQLAAERPAGSNEPVVVVRERDRYKLIEGFHRVMSYLLTGAPPDQLQKLRSGQPLGRNDLSRWRPVNIRAYLGVRKAHAPVVAPAAQAHHAA